MTTTPQKQNIVTWAFDIWEHVLANRMASISVIFINLFMIYGVLFRDWNVFYIMLLFWAENVINGVFNVIRMITAKNGGWLKLFIVPFFCFHYGMFCFVHGVFVFAIFGSGMFGTTSGATGHLVDSYLDGSFWHNIFQVSNGIGWALLMLIVNSGMTMVRDYFNNGEYKRADIGKLMSEPYGRVVQLHIALIAGGFLTIATGSAKITVVILVFAKLLLDLNYTKNHRPQVPIEEE
ncbi:MAG: DUF6498-containing protein [bacterium]